VATHGLAVSGDGATTAATLTKIGSDIVMPAGGPWKIHHIWAQAVHSAAAAAEALSGNLVVQSLSGDLTPDPAPGTFPVPGLSAAAGANYGPQVSPLKLIPVNWEAAGKATISLSYYQQLATTAAPKLAAGIIFGDTVPEVKPIVFCDGVRGTQTSASETSVGTITLSTRAKVITGIFADINLDGAYTADEEMMATIRLGSADVDLPPAQYPCARAFSPGDGTPVAEPPTPYWQFIPVNIPVVGGARIDAYIDLVTAVTVAVTVGIYLAYE